ncbi:MAG: threonine synthase, partial [Chlorobi bacterium]|nr:threonine synthase [Chlorobiota bacterium]
MKHKFIYECVDCGKEYIADGIKYLCPACAETNTPDKPPKGVLKVIYNYSEILKITSSDIFV